jgi:hypothetical protein
MPVGYHISPDDGLITVTAGGSVLLSEIARAGELMLADSTYDPWLPQLLDMRGLRPPPAGELPTLRRFVEERYRDGVRASIAVVIDEHLESLHCAEIFLLTCALHDAELFADYDQALRWLMRRAFARPDAGSPVAPPTVAQPTSSSTPATISVTEPQNR